MVAHAEETMGILGGHGCLLVSGPLEKPNVMTIGWGLIGRLWSRPVFMVAVRQGWYTHEVIEQTGDFTVNIPKGGMESAVAHCGSVSGRNHDKFKDTGMTPVASKTVKSPIIAECSVHYECKVVYKVDMIPERLDGGLLNEFYQGGNHHTLYFGQILSVY